MRRVAASIVGVVLLGSLVVGTVAADTGEPTEPYDRTTASAFAPWTDPSTGTVYDVGVEFTTEAISGTRTALFVFSSFDPTFVCDIGDPADPEDDLAGRTFSFEGMAADADVAIVIGSRLSSAAASAVVTGQETWVDECGTTTTGATRSFAIALEMAATGATDRGRARTTEVLPDGTQILRTYTSATRSSTGTLTIDDADIAAQGSIYHQTMAIRTR